MTPALTHLPSPNERLLEIARLRDRLIATDPRQLIPWLFRPCRVRILLVADGILDFGPSNVGLQAFVETLLDGPAYFVQFEITLAQRDDRTSTQMMGGHPDIARRITSFRFDNTDHFAPDRYDEMFLFGISSEGNLTGPELRAISEFMDSGRGVFATGDHGALGRALCSQIPRVRSMRLWESTSTSLDLDQVSMDGRRRNDTNRLGHVATSEFDDQSDDVPQITAPTMRSRSVGLFTVSYPHPILCGRGGVIDVMPDHPHEGECVVPTDLTGSDIFDDYTIAEYPPGAGGQPRPVPEIISESSVLSGTTSGGKAPTEAHSFGGICAYDGHRADVGRVVTDATWHHFVNVNLIGTNSATRESAKRYGFLASTPGEQTLDKIKEYYVNLVLWLAPSALVRCMNRRILWGLIFHDRVIESLITRSEIPLEQAEFPLLRRVGAHARDALGRSTSSCQEVRIASWVLELVQARELVPWVDPWWPHPRPEPDPVPWYNLDVLVDAALGGALVALHEASAGLHPDEIDKVEEAFDTIVARGATRSLQQAIEAGTKATRTFRGLLDSVTDRPSKG